MSPRKVRLVVDQIRGMQVAGAQTQLKFMNKAAAQPVLKLLDSAIANAKNNFGLDETKLFVKAIAADEGPTLHRWKPRAFGRATPIRKRSTHISIILEEKGTKVEKVEKVERKEKKVEKAKPITNK